MKLGFHYHTPAVMSEKGIMMPAYLGVFIDSLAVYCEELTCLLHIPGNNGTEQMDYLIKSNNVNLISIGSHDSIPKRFLDFRKNKKKIIDSQISVDVLLIRAFTPLLPLISNIWEKPIVLLLVSDGVVGIEKLPQPWWRKIFIKIWAEWNQTQQKKLASRCLTFVNSNLLYQQYYGKIQNLVLTKTTTLSAGDFFYREDTCLEKPVKLLFTGRISKTKGLLDIIEAMSLLLNQGYDLTLDLVGMLQTGETILDEITNRSEELGISSRVIYHGYKTAGPELLSYYRNADIFVTASKSSSEGFPRTIWEAMASSLPVVATAVGSIPDYISDAAVIVPPDNIHELSTGIKILLDDSQLRKVLIKKGMDLASENTLERRAFEMVEQIRNWLTHQK